MTLIVEIALGIVLGVVLLGVGAFLLATAVQVVNTWNPPSFREKGFLGVLLAVIGVAFLVFRWLGGRH